MENGKVRVRATGGVYRSRFLGESEMGWKFSAPLCRDAYVPLRVGEEITIEAQAEEGIILFRTSVLFRDGEDHTFTMARPKEVHASNRREEERFTEVQGQACNLEGAAANFLNVSARGACLVSDRDVKPGDWVRVQLPWTKEAVFAWVLAQEGQDRFKKVRLRFDEPVALPNFA